MIDDGKLHLMVAGSREFSSYNLLKNILDFIISKFSCEVEIVQGGARGADKEAKNYAHTNNILCKEFQAKWDEYGNCAGYIRNDEMMSYISQFKNRYCICFWNGVSRGTAQNFDLAEKYKVDLVIVNYTTGEIETRKEGKKI